MNSYRVLRIVYIGIILAGLGYILTAIGVPTGPAFCLGFTGGIGVAYLTSKGII